MYPPAANPVSDNQYSVTVGGSSIKEGSWVTLTDCVGSDYVRLRVNYHSAVRDEFNTWIIDDYEIEVLDHSVPGLTPVGETDFDRLYPLINRFPDADAELELVPGMFVLEKAGRYGIGGPKQEVVVEIRGARYPILDSLGCIVKPLFMTFGAFPVRLITCAQGNTESARKNFMPMSITERSIQSFFGDDGPGFFTPFDGSRMSGELGLYHAIRGYYETPEGMPEYEWLDRVGVLNRKGT